MKNYLARVKMKVIGCFAFGGEFERVVELRKTEVAR
jgi:hypothetical protein